MNTDESRNHTLALHINQRSDLPMLKLGQPSFFWEPSMKLFVEPTRYLHDEYCATACSASPHTWLSVGHSLVLWFDYLSMAEVPDWRMAAVDDLKEYFRQLSTAMSPKTHKSYAPGTIRDRMLPVIGLYTYGKREGWYEGDLASEKCAGSAQAKSAQTTQLQKLVPKARRNKAKVRPLSKDEYDKLAPALGPMPSERATNDERPVRDRVIIDTGIFVGLRVEEIEGLTRHPFQALTPDPGAPGVMFPIRVKGKGSKGSGPQERTVAFPAWLIIEINIYINTERAQAIKIGNVDDPGTLFLSGADSNRPGSRMTKRRYQQIVEEGCLKAGLVEIERRIDPDTGKPYEVKRPLHCFHDLRHTYATWRYWVETAEGNSEPWKGIQAQLGHKLLSTTMETYVHYVEIFSGAQRPVNIRDWLGI